jgi:hypothetical protein
VKKWLQVALAIGLTGCGSTPHLAHRDVARIAPSAYPTCVANANALSVATDVCEGLVAGRTIPDWDAFNQHSDWKPAGAWQMDGAHGFVGGPHCWVWTGDTSIEVCPDGTVGTT